MTVIQHILEFLDFLYNKVSTLYLPMGVVLLVLSALNDNPEMWICFLSLHLYWISLNVLDYFAIFYVPWGVNKIFLSSVVQCKESHESSCRSYSPKVFFEVTGWRELPTKLRKKTKKKAELLAMWADGEIIDVYLEWDSFSPVDAKGDSKRH